MPKAIDITGKKFGRLTAVAPDFSTKKRMWKFVCDCGNVKISASAYVKNGNISSCGCLRKEETAKRNAINLVGKRFGRLLVISEINTRDRHGKVSWSCVCDCGRTTSAATSSLTKGATRSCGCLRTEMMRALGASSKQENPVSKTKEYRSAIRKKIREKPEKAMAERVSRLMAWALASVGAIKRSSTFELLGYTPAELKAHIEKQFLKGMSWDNRNEWEVDHIIPISSATCEADVVYLNQLSNLRPLWAADNNRKGRKQEHLI